MLASMQTWHQQGRNYRGAQACWNLYGLEALGNRAAELQSFAVIAFVRAVVMPTAVLPLHAVAANTAQPPKAGAAPGAVAAVAAAAGTATVVLISAASMAGEALTAARVGTALVPQKVAKISAGASLPSNSMKFRSLSTCSEGARPRMVSSRAVGS